MEMTLFIDKRQNTTFYNTYNTHFRQIFWQQILKNFSMIIQISNLYFFHISTVLKGSKEKLEEVSQESILQYCNIFILK